MSFVRITLALFIGIAVCFSAVAQDNEPSGVFVTKHTFTRGSVGYIARAIESLKFQEEAAKEKRKDQVVTNLAEHPVHAMRRRKAMRDEVAPSSSITAFAAAKEIGLHGKWFVTFGKKDGHFSEAQIGQQPGDVITMLPKEDARGLTVPVG